MIELKELINDAYSVRTVAKLLNKSEITIRHYIGNGKLESTIIDRKRVILKAHLIKYMENNTEPLRVKEVATLTNQSEKTIQRHIKKGLLKATKSSGKVYIDKQDFDVYLVELSKLDN